MGQFNSPHYNPKYLQAKTMALERGNNEKSTRFSKVFFSVIVHSQLGGDDSVATSTTSSIPASRFYPVHYQYFSSFELMLAMNPVTFRMLASVCNYTNFPILEPPKTLRSEFSLGFRVRIRLPHLGRSISGGSFILVFCRPCARSSRSFGGGS
jgi:hypothetical protein